MSVEYIKQFIAENKTKIDRIAIFEEWEKKVAECKDRESIRNLNEEYEKTRKENSKLFDQEVRLLEQLRRDLPHTSEESIKLIEKRIDEIRYDTVCITTHVVGKTPHILRPLNAFF